MTKRTVTAQPPPTPEEVERLLALLQEMAVEAPSRAVAAEDLGRVNRLAKSLADRHYTFWDNPADLVRVLRGDGRGGAP